jgi:phosphate transport system substrate-binding protein
MSYGLNKFSTRTKLLAGALALVLAGASHATGTLVGGGATLPSVGYVGTNAATTSTLQFSGSGIASGSLFGVYEAQTGNPAVSYCLTGSGAGKNILAGGTIGSSSYSVQNACSSSKLGFGAPAVSRTDLTQPNFAAADSPLAASDLANYQATGAHGSSAWPTQFPVIAGAVGIGFNLLDSSGAQVTASEVNLSTVQVCKIFSGTITNWNDTGLSSAFSLPSGRTIPSTPINVQYRSDGSGTSFSLSNYLTNNCGSAGLSHVFETNQTFGATAGGAGGTPAAGSVISNFFTTLPSNWNGVSGNTAVANAIAPSTGGNGNIGYVETANAVALALPKLQLASIAGKSPITNFGSPLTITSAAVVYNEVISTTNATNGTAQLTAITSPPSTQCIALVPPADYAVAGSKGGIVPSTSYPIVAISYFLGNAQSNGTDLTNTANLVNAPYNSTITGSVTTVGSGKGLAFLTLGTGAFSATAPGACLH